MLTMLMVVIVTVSTLFPFIVGKYVFFRSIVDLALIFFLLGLLFDEKRAPRFWERLQRLYHNPLVLAVSAFVGIFLLAGFFGVDPHFSFWSNFERGEGGIQMLHFYIFFMLLLSLFREEKDWRELFWWALGGSVLMGIYGLLAGVGVHGFVGARFSDASFRFQGSIGNPAYVAIYVLFTSFYGLYLLSSEYRKKLTSPGALAIMGSLVFFAVIFLLAATRGAFLGLIAAIVVGLAYLGFTNKKWRKKFSITAGFVVIVVALLVAFQGSPVVKSIPGSRIFDITTAAKTFQDRATMWKIAWDGFVERPVLGWGPENFIHIFDRDFNTAYFKPAEGFGAWFDRAHSIIFDYLAETGVLGFLAYASMFVCFLYLFWSSRRREGGPTPFERALFLAMLVAYLVQGLVLFDVSVTYINLFTVLAFAVYKFQIPSSKPQINSNDRMMKQAPDNSVGI